MAVRDLQDPSMVTHIGGIGVSSTTLVALEQMKAEVITFLNITPGTSEQIIRGSQGSTYFGKWNGTVYEG